VTGIWYISYCVQNYEIRKSAISARSINARQGSSKLHDEQLGEKTLKLF